MLPSPDDDGSEEEEDEPPEQRRRGERGTIEVRMDVDEAPDRSAEPIWLGVLPRNVPIVAVFRRCQPQLGVGMGVLWQGVGAREVFPACVMSHIPRRDWPRTLDGVQIMARTVANVRNEEEKERAEKRARE